MRQLITIGFFFVIAYGLQRLFELDTRTLLFGFLLGMGFLHTMRHAIAEDAGGKLK